LIDGSRKVTEAYHNKDEKPIEQARCGCGVKTDWFWDDDPEYWDEGDGEWCEKSCWRCSEIVRMKWELTGLKLGLGGRLNDEQADRFIELVVSQASISQAVHVTRFAWPFPWLKPWLWPAWIVWRIKRGKSKASFRVPL
jgi:hypothetical protein